MSDPISEPRPATSPQPAPIMSGRRGAAVIGFATALIVFGLLVITGAFWAPAVAPLFTGSAVSVSPLAQRLAQLEAGRRDDQQKTAQMIAAVQKTAADTAATLQQLDHRLGALESKPAAMAGDMADLGNAMEAIERQP